MPKPSPAYLSAPVSLSFHPKTSPFITVHVERISLAQGTGRPEIRSISSAVYRVVAVTHIKWSKGSRAIRHALFLAFISDRFGDSTPRKSAMIAIMQYAAPRVTRAIISVVQLSFDMHREEQLSPAMSSLGRGTFSDASLETGAHNCWVANVHAMSWFEFMAILIRAMMLVVTVNALFFLYCFMEI